MNLMVYRWGRDCVVVDAGMMFPGAEHLGVEVVLPDLSFLDDCGTLHGVVLTHGHEDHVGALSYLLARHDIPVYSTAYTENLVRKRLAEHGMLADAGLRPLPDSGTLDLGPFSIEALAAAHSIPGARMLAIRTPVGLVVHTADFKLDPDPMDGVGTDLARLAELGREGVLALLSDSTNADREGFTPGERTVGAALDRLIGSHESRVVVTVFSSHTHRLQQLGRIAQKSGRSLTLVGASLQNHAEVAERLGVLRIPEPLRVSADRAMDLPERRSLIVVAGSQGEPMSALSRIAVDRHRDISLEPGTLVIHSARRIPGNEKSIGRLINHLLRRGCEVVTAEDQPVHVSGHGSAAELALVIQLLRPRFMIPIHGEYRQLLAHARIAAACGLDSDRIQLADSGDVIAIDEQTVELRDRVHVGQVFVDADLTELDREILRDRRRIAGGGIVVPVVAVHRETGAVNGYPEIMTRGFPHLTEDGSEDSEELLREARKIVADSLAEASPEERTDEGLLRARIQTVLKRFLRRRMQRPPLILPVILEL